MFDGEIVGYVGKGTLKQRFLLGFIKKRYKTCLITFDLDAEEELGSCVQDLGFLKDKHCFPIGIDAPGRRAIEGLVPDRIRSAVFAANADVVQQVMSGTKKEQLSAKNKLKKLLLEEFKRSAKPGDDDYRHFYALTRMMNKSLSAAERT